MLVLEVWVNRLRRDRGQDRLTIASIKSPLHLSSEDSKLGKIATLDNAMQQNKDRRRAPLQFLSHHSAEARLLCKERGGGRGGRTMQLCSGQALRRQKRPLETNISLMSVNCLVGF